MSKQIVILLISFVFAAPIQKNLVTKSIKDLHLSVYTKNQLSNYHLTYHLHFFEFVFFMNYKITVKFPSEFLFQNEGGLINGLISVGKFVKNVYFKSKVNDNVIKINPMEIFSYENFGKLQKVFQKQDRHSDIDIIVTLIDVKNPNKLNPMNITVELGSNHQNFAYLKKNFTINFQDSLKSKLFRVESDCNFIGNGFYSSPIYVWPSDSLKTSYKIYLFANIAMAKVSPPILFFSPENLTRKEIKIIVPRQELRSNTNFYIRIFAKIIVNNELVKFEDFEDYQIEVINLTSPTSLEIYKNDPIQCFPKIQMYPVLQHFVPSISTYPIDVQLSHFVSSNITLNHPNKKMISDDNIKVSPKELVIKADTNYFSFQIKIKLYKFFEFRFTMNFEVFDISAFENLDMKDFFLNLNTYTSNIEKRDITFLDSPSFLSVRNYFIKKMEFINKDIYHLKKQIETISFIFLIIDKINDFELKSLGTQEMNPPLLGSNIESKVKSVFNLQKQKVPFISGKFMKFSILNRLIQITNQNHEICLVFFKKKFLPNFRKKSIIYSTFERHCLLPVIREQAFNFRIKNKYFDGLEVYRMNSDYHNENFYINLILDTKNLRNRYGFAFINTQINGSYFLKIIFNLDPASFPVKPKMMHCFIRSCFSKKMLRKSLFDDLFSESYVLNFNKTDNHQKVSTLQSKEKCIKKWNKSYMIIFPKDYENTLKSKLEFFNATKTNMNLFCKNSAHLFSPKLFASKLSISKVEKNEVSFSLIIKKSEIVKRYNFDVKIYVWVRSLSNFKTQKCILVKPKNSTEFTLINFKYDRKKLSFFQDPWTIIEKQAVSQKNTADQSSVLMEFKIKKLKKHNYYSFSSKICVNFGHGFTSNCEKVKMNQNDITTDDFQYKIRYLNSESRHFLDILIVFVFCLFM